MLLGVLNFPKSLFPFPKTVTYDANFRGETECNMGDSKIIISGGLRVCLS